MESPVSGGRVCKWRINLSRVKRKLKKKICHLFYIVPAGLSLIHYSVPPRKTLPLQDRRKVWKSGGEGNQDCGGYNLPLLFESVNRSEKKICVVTALRPCFLPETETLLADCTFYHLCFQLVVYIAFSDQIILVQCYMSLFNWKTCSNHSFVCDASFWNKSNIGVWQI